MPQGTVKWVNFDKEFGFIKQDDSQKDLYFHSPSVKHDRISIGDSVEYEITDSLKGPCAINVKRV